MKVTAGGLHCVALFIESIFIYLILSLAFSLTPSENTYYLELLSEADQDVIF